MLIVPLRRFVRCCLLFWCNLTIVMPMQSSHHSNLALNHNNLMRVMDLFLDNLNELRERRGWSWADLHRKSGVSDSYISLLRSRQRVPTIEIVERLANALGVEPDVLLSAALPEEADLRSSQALDLFRSLSDHHQGTALEVLRGLRFQGGSDSD